MYREIIQITLTGVSTNATIVQERQESANYLAWSCLNQESVHYLALNRDYTSLSSELIVYQYVP